MDIASRFIIAGQSILMNNLSTPWDDIPAETTDTLPPSVMSDRIEYVVSRRYRYLSSEAAGRL